MADIFVIGGPNGAGKSTTAREMLPAFIGCVEFVVLPGFSCDFGLKDVGAPPQTPPHPLLLGV